MARFHPLSRFAIGVFFKQICDSLRVKRDIIVQPFSHPQETPPVLPVTDTKPEEEPLIINTELTFRGHDE